MNKVKLTHGADDGFTLVETIVAFLVLAIAMGIATQTINMATAGIARSAGSERAIELVESIHLIEVPKLVVVGLDVAEGADERGHWKIKLNPQDGQNYGAGSFFGFTSIEVSVSSNPGHPESFVYFDNWRAK